jgi:protein gp37
MGSKTSIEWTADKDGNAGASWNPIRARDLGPVGTGPGIGSHCEIVSPGCEHCYAQAINQRLGTHRPYLRTSRKEVQIYLDEKMLTAPLRWRKPRRIFVGSMTDLFGDWVTDEMLDRIFAVMALCPQHTFLVLTKRAERMRDYCSPPPFLLRSLESALRCQSGRSTMSGSAFRSRTSAAPTNASRCCSVRRRQCGGSAPSLYWRRWIFENT